MPARPPRGFALIIVVICSIAMVAIAVALVFTAGSSRLVSIKGSAIDQSETIALAGMERAVAYAERVADVERDFDLLLDPAETIDCDALIAAQTSPQRAGAGDSGIPRFTDAGQSIGTHDGRRYRVVPFNSGAYLVRYDDDADDAEVNPLLAAFTGNRPQGGKCTEGLGKNNPFRDRNRAVWITVVGIYPGTDPARARHRTSLRRFHISTASTPGPAIHVDGNIDFEGDLTFCSNVGDIAAGGNIDFDGGDRACGRADAAGTVNGPTPAAPSCPVGNCTAPGGSTDGAPFSRPFPDPISNFDPDMLFWFNARQPHCNFYVVEEAPLGGLFFWDVTRKPECATIPTSTDPTTKLPSPTLQEAADGDDDDACWSPLLLHNGTTLFDPLNIGIPEVNDPDWRPGSATGTFTIDGAAGLPLFSGSARKPDWGTCFVPWKGSGGPRARCTDDAVNGCTGTVAAASLVGGRLKFRSSVALPPGMYRFKDADRNAGDIFVATSPSGLPVSDATPAGFGHGTFLIGGNFIGNADVALGIGQERAPFASLVVKDNVTFRSGQQMVFAGSLIAVRGNILFESGSFPSGGPPFHFHGMIVAGDGNLDVKPSANLNVDYDEDLFGGGGSIPASPTTSRTIR